MASEVLLEKDPRGAANIAANATNHGEIEKKDNKKYEVGDFDNDTWYATFTREPFGCKMRYPSKGSDKQDNVVDKMRDALAPYEVS
jgi:hypothetical protein